MATARSLKLSIDGKRQVDLVLTGKAWRDAELAEAIEASEQTAEKFRLGRKVDRKYFVKFCKALGIDWATVAESESLPAPNSGGAEPVEKIISTTAENLQQNSNDAQGVQVQGSETTIVGQTVNVYQGSAQEVTAVPSSALATVDEEKIRQHCREKILRNYSKIRLLSGQEIGVDQLYVDVWLLDRSPRTFQRSADKMLETFDLRNDRLGLGDRIQRNPGFDIANRDSKLLILGKPGSGKTTFLKHLAVDWCNGKFRPNLIAIFIEFRQICDGKWSLLDEIGKEVQIQDKEQVEVLLKNGKLLIVMDGFDEVPTQSLRTQVQNQLRQVAKDYSKNCFIMTCRTQIMQGIPDGFASVEVADFNINQVQGFVYNWFRANNQNELEIEAQWQNFKLAIDNNLALQELTVTPVLLGLIILVLQDEGEIPAQAGLLYERGVRLLLQKWNNDKAIGSWEIGTASYRKLDVEQKEKLLIEIAARKFENPKNFVLFNQDDLLKQISQYLSLVNQSDSIEVLKAIESQHGLLVERADELWSFSHLTFQEYFTTKWLLKLSSKELSEKIGNQQWQGVVEQLVKAQGQSDRLLKHIKQAIDYSISDDSLQKFLSWIKEKTCDFQDNNYPSALRAYFFSLPQSRDQVLSQLLHWNDKESSSDLSLDHELILTLNYELKNLPGFRKSCSLARILDLKFLKELEFLSCQLPYVSPKSPNELYEFDKWWSRDGKNWIEQLRQVSIKYRNIGHDWKFTIEQQQRLKSYYNANKFLVKLLRIENAISPEVRQEIEDNLLLPIAELKHRLPDQYTS